MKLGKDISAVVTGGASGLGEATVRMLRDAGCTVAIFDMNAERGEQIAKETGATFCECNVADVDSVDAALEKARAAQGQERILVNCAGIGPAAKTAGRKRQTGEITAHDPAQFAKVIQVNLIGSFHMCSRSAAGMLTLDPINDDGSRGVMVSTASVAAVEGQVGQVAYSASKGGVLGMTLPMARDLAGEGIRVLAIMPGLFHTPLFDTLPDEVAKSLAASVPHPSRLGRPDEYAAMVKHMCENDMLNGTAVRLDGAIRMQPR